MACSIILNRHSRSRPVWRIRPKAEYPYGSSVNLYVSYTIPGCAESPRTLVTASVDPNIIATSPTYDTICAGNSVTLNVGASGGITVIESTKEGSCPQHSE